MSFYKSKPDNNIQVMTYKVKHNIDYSGELDKAKQIAIWAIENKFQTSSKHVKHIGLKSALANQVLKKYGRNKKAKEVSNIKLTIPASNGNIQIRNNKIYVPCLNKAYISPWFDLKNILKINQIEVDNTYYYISVSVGKEPLHEPSEFIGIDLNTTEHPVVIASGTKILKRGRKIPHVKKKYGSLRRKLQKQKKRNQLSKLKHRERNLVRNELHCISKEVVELAKKEGKGIRLEDLTHIRQRTRKKSNRTTRRATNNWNFYQLRQMIEYKARICGVKVELVHAHYTSKTCSKCLTIGNRNGKHFKCSTCGHIDHADSNAAFNIGKAISGVVGMSKVPHIRADDNINSDIISEPAKLALGVKAT